MSKSVKWIDRADKIEKTTELLTECCHTHDFVQAYSDENDGLHRHTKPPTYNFYSSVKGAG